ncbi:ATP-binding protein [Paenibacillus sp. D2_2]|uniref:ATP-binding protein n=1 Tax=Paenibacillus sp. D2_2 TaxID=3073092 RepID=UPI0028149CCE|nr:ATP-binding protein [Paenibacillus sp. D2_2]WMT39266.1 ATP-binding protein [Paenibacillus sp. D2_2]
MNAPYKDCEKCFATPFCKRYSGETDTPAFPEWCNPKFRLNKALKLSEIPRKYLKANFYNYEVDDDNRYIYKGLSGYVENIVEEVEENGTNFFFWNSGAGTGKTYNAAMLLNHYIYKTCMTGKFDFENPLALFVSYSELMDDLRYRRDDEAVQKQVSIIKEVPFLLLDDVGAGTTSKFTVEQMYLIVNERFNEGRATIFTSNFDSQTLSDEEVIGKRTVSRLMSECVGVQVEGRDRRKVTVKGVIKRA